MNLKVGDKVRIKDNVEECEFGYTSSMLKYIGGIATIMKINYEDEIELDIDNQTFSWSENVLELINDVKMKRIDYILNAKDNIQAILDETILDCNICPSSCEDCNGDCEFYYKKYLNEEIEVDKSKLKLVEEVKRDEETETVERGEEVVNDSVNHPSHYTDGKIEVMDFIEDKQLNFARGNVIKYVSRAGKKDPNKELEDLNKAMWYLKREIERLEKEE